MDLTDAIQSTLNGSAVLFAGSGFSYGAKNTLCENLPSGTKLRDVLATECGFSNVNHGLGKVADYYEEEFSTEDLIKIIKKYCTNVSHVDYHEKIMSLPWRGIYTTNYDKVIENSALKRKKIITPITYSNDFENTDKSNICVHINGYIDKLDSTTINKEFRLTDSSYNCDALVGNSWYDYMVNDFMSAEAIIVIGFSMDFDVDITRLFSAPSMKEKVVFISSPNTDKFSLNTLNKYGICYPIGVQEFGVQAELGAEDFIPSNSFIYRSFEHDYRTPLSVAIPTYEEISKFYMLGDINDKLFTKKLSGEYQYLISRKAIDVVMREYTHKKVFLAVSDLGNGKTIFTHLVKKEFSDKDVSIFTFKHRYKNIDDEIMAICKMTKRTLVIIDNYPGHLDILKQFYYHGCKHISFILTARNSVNNLSYSKLCRVLNIENDEIKPLYLSHLESNELSDMAHVMKMQSLMANSEDEIIKLIEEKCGKQLSAFLLERFKSTDIKNRLVKLYSSINDISNSRLRETAIFLLIHCISNLDVDLVEVLDLLSADYLNFEKSNSEFLSEVFDFSEGSIKLKSSIVAQELIKCAIPLNDTVDVLIKVFLEADKRKTTTYDEMKKSLVSHSQFMRFINYEMSNEQAYSEIERFYDRIRNSNFARSNPLFWEQFASAYLDMKKYDMAKQCLDLAMKISEKLEWFIPYQVKTVYARYHVEKSIEDLNTKTVTVNTDNAIESIIAATDCLLEYFETPENNVYYVFKVAEKYKDVYDCIKEQMDKRQYSIYIEQSGKIVRKMNNYLEINKDSLYYKRVERWMNSLSASVDDAKEAFKRSK